MRIKKLKYFTEKIAINCSACYNDLMYNRLKMLIGGTRPYQADKTGRIRVLLSEPEEQKRNRHGVNSAICGMTITGKTRYALSFWQS